MGMANNSILADFGNRVRTLRKELGYSQEELGEACDLDRTYISGIERGLRNVSLKNIAIIADALDVSLHEFFAEM